MSRFPFKEPLATVQRRISSSPPHASSNSPPRHLYQSKVLAALDAELDRMKHLEMGATVSRGTISNTMKMALDASSTGGRQGEYAVQEKLTHPFFLKPSVGSTKTLGPSRSPAFGSTSTNFQTGKGQSGGTSVEPPHLEPSKDLPHYPLYSYKSTTPMPTRFYVRDETQANELAARLEGPLGFDLEWRVFFNRKMAQRKTAILQLCDDRTILIIQLAAMKHFPDKVKDIVESQDIIKMGVNILNDGRKLWRDYGIEPAGLLELSHLARLADPSRINSKRMISLQRIVEMYTGCTLSKGNVRISNWEAHLSEEQLEYAANDAHAALKVYTELRRLAQEAGLVLHPVVTPATLSTPAMGIAFKAEPSNAPEGASRNTPSSSTEPSSAHSSKRGLRPEDRHKTGNADIHVGPSSRPRSGIVPITSLPQASVTKARRPLTGQLLRAYKLWHEEQLPLPEICGALRSPEHPLTKGTVITYVVEALKADPSLPFSRTRLTELAKLENGSWQRHGRWITSLDKTTRGIPIGESALYRYN